MAQTRKSEKSARRSPEPLGSAPRLGDTTKQRNEAIDLLLDDIDDVLEKNAEEFVKSYVQRGGE